MTEENIDDVKQAYALLFKAHGELREERDALLDKVRDYGGRMTDEQSSTLAELDEAIAAAPTEAKPAQQDAVDAITDDMIEEASPALHEHAHWFTLGAQWALAAISAKKGGAA